MTSPDFATPLTHEAPHPGVELLVPELDRANPEISIVVPSLNEEITVGEFVEWCWQGLEKAGIRGEVLLVDSSTDATAAIALSHGARVLRVPRRGLGQAYRDAVPYIRAPWVIVGDADCTYDFREIGEFVDALRGGAEFVMGSRFRGQIESGAMPPHHRYFGSPLTTKMLNLLFGSHFSDIHCGMRALTLDALKRIDLQAQGWEYASEMIVKSIRLGLETKEVPISFYRDRKGRVSHVKRSGWLTPWRAGWDTLRVLFTNAADFFLLRPGGVLALVAALGTLLLSLGPVTINSVTLTLHAQALFLAMAAIGAFGVSMGIVARCNYDPTTDTVRRWVRRLSFNRAAVIAGLLGASGLFLDAVFVSRYMQNEMRVDASMQTVSHLAITGLAMTCAGFMVFMLTLVVHAIAATRAQLAGEDLLLEESRR